MPDFSVNTDELIVLTAKLEKLNRSAFPLAVRRTLTDAAYKAKQLSVETAAKSFSGSKRPKQSQFIASHTVYAPAKGFNVKTMNSKVGIGRSKGKVNKKTLEELGKQETGGSVKSGHLVPHDKSRTGSSFNKRIASKNKLSDIDYIKGNPKVSRGTKSNIVAQAYKAQKTGKHLLVKKNKKGKVGNIFEIRRLRFLKRGGAHRRVKFSVKPLYVYRNQKHSELKAKPFIKPAASKASKFIPEFYHKASTKEFNKVLKK